MDVVLGYDARQRDDQGEGSGKGKGKEKQKRKVVAKPGPRTDKEVVVQYLSSNNDVNLEDLAKRWRMSSLT